MWFYIKIRQNQQFAGAPGEVHVIAKSPFAPYKLTFHHLVMRFVTFIKQLISYYAQIPENNAINSTTSYIDPPVLTSRVISHWRIVMVFQ